MASHGNNTPFKVDAAANRVTLGSGLHIADEPSTSDELGLDATEDSFLTVLLADESTEHTTENEEFTLVGARHGVEALIGKAISAEVEDEPGTTSLATAVKTIKAMSKPELVNYCARVLLPYHKPEPEHRQALYNNLVYGLEFIANSAQEWIIYNDSIEVVRQRIMHNLYAVPTHTQWCIAQLIGKLLVCNDWVKHDEEVIDLGDFEISAAIWLFKVGLRVLALSRVQPRSAVELALDCEQKWLSENDIEEEEKQLRGFAADLKLWGRNLESKGSQ